MFSGIVEEIGRVTKVYHQPGILSLFIESISCLKDLKSGDSISVNGVCLTVCYLTPSYFVVDLMPETLRVSTLSTLKEDDYVNLELALRANSRIGGHWIQGHIDGTTIITHMEPDGCALKVWFQQLSFWQECLIPKGFVTIDGMSLTLVDVTESHFSVCLIPHTQNITIAQAYQIGIRVNIEVDHITKTAVLALKSLITPIMD